MGSQRKRLNEAVILPLILCLVRLQFVIVVFPDHTHLLFFVFKRTTSLRGFFPVPTNYISVEKWGKKQFCYSLLSEGLGPFLSGLVSGLVSATTISFCLYNIYLPTPLLTSILEPVFSMRYKSACAYSENSNQSAHPRSLIRVLVYRPRNVLHFATHRAPIEDSRL